VEGLTPKQELEVPKPPPKRGAVVVAGAVVPPKIPVFEGTVGLVVVVEPPKSPPPVVVPVPPKMPPVVVVGVLPPNSPPPVCPRPIPPPVVPPNMEVPGVVIGCGIVTPGEPKMPVDCGVFYGLFQELKGLVVEGGVVMPPEQMNLMRNSFLQYPIFSSSSVIHFTTCFPSILLFFGLRGVNFPIG
jgi:hypothetical protein